MSRIFAALPLTRVVRSLAAASAAVLVVATAAVPTAAVPNSSSSEQAPAAPPLRHWTSCAPIVVEVVPTPLQPLLDEEVALVVLDLASLLGLNVEVVEGDTVPTPAWVGSAPTSSDAPDRILRVGVAEHGPLLTEGLNGEARAQTTPQGEIVRASVVISQDVLSWMVPGEGVTNPGSRLRMLIMHELGHAFGLPHSQSTLDVMVTPAITYRGPRDAWGPGDLSEIDKRRKLSACPSDSP